MTLTEFLLARIAEDEDSADYAGDMNGYVSGTHWLSECEAKRRIVSAHHKDDEKWCPSCSGQYQPCVTMRLLALPYADHPDYREEWRP